MREEALLAQAHVLTKKHEELAAATGQNFNLFKILGRETDEVRTHSAIIAELLNPKGSHGQGPVFARLFAKRFKIEIPEAEIDSLQVWAEKTVGDNSRIDILMVAGDLCVVIENKIYAGDQPKQLERYHEHAAQWPCSKVIYLTLHGDGPSDDSLGELPKDEVDCRSYESDVLAWLNDCIKEVARVPQIREILAHYEELLRKLTGKSKGEVIMDLKELLGKKLDDENYNFQLVPDIAKAMTAFSVETEWNFWKSLKARLEAGDQPWRLKTLDADEAGSIPVKEVDEGIIEHAHTGSRKTREYGWTFRVKSDSNHERYKRDDVEVLLRVECDGWGWGAYGFIAVERMPDGMRWLSRDEDVYGLFDEWGERLSGLENWRTDATRWLAWRYPSADIALQKMTGNWLAPDVIRQLRKESAVDPLVVDIQGTIDKLEKWSANSNPGQ
ncbi:MAG: hypothetical protein F4149_14310 [Gammaproteobacteria bacterium]|nr:hypothetical protein [Gammaproteobacteria bacterium]